MKTIENNKLIAEFLGLKVVSTYDFDLSNLNIRNISELGYHSSWDWLMPVVEKIESVTNTKDVDFLKELYNYVRNNKNIFDLKLSETKLPEALKYCIEFIKWYNENK